MGRLGPSRWAMGRGGGEDAKRGVAAIRTMLQPKSPLIDALRNGLT